MFKQISRFKKGIPILVMSILLGIQIGLSAKTVLGIQKRFYITQKIDSAPPIIDGKLTEKIWQNVKWEGNFIQIIPEEGKKSSEKTRFKIIYDNRYLYIAIRADDRTPDKIIRRLDRHDSHDGDWVAVNIDSYHDLSTAFCFTVNAAGVRADKLISNNGDKHDGSWDPIWQAKTSIDEQGWLAELRIPLDQLRFSNADKMTWGLQIQRKIFRNDELSYWQYIPRNAPGSVHLYGKLEGVEKIKTKIKIDLMPYTVGKAERFEPVEGDPFATGKVDGMTMGLDGKINLTSDLTLDFTVNPDFGQVEADPSEVNLTAFESYFREKRPFFVEGNNILNFQIMTGDGTFSKDNLFYSRRIGRSPQFYPDTKDGEYLNQPVNTAILGAFKLTGKTSKGLSIGIMNSTTAKELAEIDRNSDRRMETVEPLTNYLLVRAQQDLGKGNTKIGAMMTATNRNIQDQSLNFLHDSAYTGGIDFSHSWKQKSYNLSLNLVFSRVSGDKEAIRQTQESPLRYFQRPDAPHIELDPDRTSLSGYGGTIKFTRSGNSNLRYQAGITFRSPGLELNDVGYLRMADMMMQWLWAGYSINKPFFIFRRINFNFNQWLGYNFNMEKFSDGGNVGMYAQFKNYWSISCGVNPQGRSLSASTLRGGPSLLRPGGFSHWLYLNSDSRKKFRFTIGTSNYWVSTRPGKNHYYMMGVSYNPNKNLSISLQPSLAIRKNRLQYVTTVGSEDPSYLLGHLDQHTFGLTLRLNYTISPSLSLQFYGQPFISSGQYAQFGKVLDPRAESFEQRIHQFNGVEIQYDSEHNQYHINDTLMGNQTYTIDNPDFKFIQFRSNLVIRWEYRPGSTVYLVWSQGRTASYSDYSPFSFRNDFNRLFDIKPHHVFLVKFTYRFKI